MFFNISFLRNIKIRQCFSFIIHILTTHNIQKITKFREINFFIQIQMEEYKSLQDMCVIIWLIIKTLSIFTVTFIIILHTWKRTIKLIYSLSNNGLRSKSPSKAG